MQKRRMIKGILLLLLVVQINAGCTPPPPPPDPHVTVEETPPPDYTVIDAALKDPSQGVKLQAIAHLKQIDHITALDRLLQVIMDNPEDRKIAYPAADGLIKFGDKAINPVKDNLWNSRYMPAQEAAFKVLSAVNNTPEFYQEAKERFYARDIQYNIESAFYRQMLARYLVENADKENIDTIPDIIAMIQLPDEQVANMAGDKVAEWKDNRVIDPLFQVFYNDRKNSLVATNTLKILYAFDVPDHGVNPTQMLDDITLLLETFGSYHIDIEDNSYKALKKFAYGDPDGLIVNYIKKFENCNDELVRTHVIDLLQTLPQKQYPPGVTPPAFEIPTNTDRGPDYCSF
jgi:hypothetical protein